MDEGGASPGGTPATLDLPDDDRPRRVDRDPQPGTLIGRFEVTGRLGAGGMGVVYAARDPDLGRRVAIKLMRPELDGAGSRTRLLREAQAMGQLDHPNVVRVHEVGDHDDRMYVAMELVDGDSLTRWLESIRTWREIVAVFRQTIDGLAAVHRVGLVHRDVKPDNVLVDRGGRARLADFGLVRAESGHTERAPTPALAHQLTRTGAVLGTPGYMAPEQLDGGPVDARTDQYSLCMALRLALRDVTPRPPAAVLEVLARGTAVDRTARFPSMEALAAALDRAVARPRRVRLALAGGLVAAGAGVAIVVAVAVASSPPGSTSSSAGPIAPISVEPGAPDAAPSSAAPGTADAAPSSPAPGAPDAAPAPTPAPAATPPRAHAPAPPPTRAAPPSSAAPASPARTTVRTRIADPANLAAARAAIRDLGYRAVGVAALDADLDGTEREYRDAVAARVDAGEGGSVEAATARAVLAMIARRRGDCAAAVPLAREAIHALDEHYPARNNLTLYLWAGRAHATVGLCRLAAGDLAGTRKAFRNARMIGWGKASALENAELDFAWAILDFEEDSPAAGSDHGGGVLRRAAQTASSEGDDRLLATIETWRKTVGARYR